MKFDLRSVPFSRYGSYIAFSLLPGKDNGEYHLWMRQVGGQGQKELFQIELLSRKEDAGSREWVSCALYEVSATPAVIELVGSGGKIKIVIASENVVRVHGEGGVGLRLRQGEIGAFGNALPWTDGRWLVNMAQSGQQFMLTALEGRLFVDAPWEVTRCSHVVIDLLPDDKSGVVETAIDMFEASWEERSYVKPFSECVSESQADFDRFYQMCPSVPGDFVEAARLAAYVDWSCVVAAKGLIKRSGMFMSKNWMTNIWSWDHCFNALALSYNAPVMAWNQFMVIFDQQLPNGQLPDMVNNTNAIWNFVKPPVHGWTLRHLLQNSNQIGIEHLEQIYPLLVRFTDWWFKYRNPDGDGLPQYHHGNDSGWDNATVFDLGFPVKGADLAAFLILQMDVLAEIARRLGKLQEEENWQRRSDALLKKLLARFWQGNHFISPRWDGKVADKGESLFNCLPVVLGLRLPEEVRQNLVRNIKRMMTPFGPATEHPDSPLYEADGYWRGPIWAPSTLLIVDGLRSCGEVELAADIARRFCNMARQNGFAENYNALTGEPLRDKAYTWTASSFLVLAHEYI